MNRKQDAASPLGRHCFLPVHLVPMKFPLKTGLIFEKKGNRPKALTNPKEEFRWMYWRISRRNMKSSEK